MLSYWTGENHAAKLLHHYLPIYMTDYGMSFVENEAQFRFPIGFQIILALLSAALVLVLPESPRWVSIDFQPYSGCRRLTL
jgi:hypothetical protein